MAHWLSVIHSILTTLNFNEIWHPIKSWKCFSFKQTITAGKLLLWWAQKNQWRIFLPLQRSWPILIATWGLTPQTWHPKPSQNHGPSGQLQVKICKKKKKLPRIQRCRLGLPELKIQGSWPGMDGCRDDNGLNLSLGVTLYSWLINRIPFAYSFATPGSEAISPSVKKKH